MQVQKNKVVSLSYTLKLDSGEVVDQADEKDPFLFIHGIGQTLEHFDKNLEGLSVGAGFEFSLEADDAYGNFEEEKIVPIPKNVFAEVPSDQLYEGAEFPMNDNFGNRLFGVVQAVAEDSIVMDFNHPLSGEKLFFSGKILEIRDASAEELDHGHVHGPGGHHHH